MFQSRRITFDMFDLNPMLLNDPSLVVKIGVEYYPWSIAGPVVTSVAVFQRPLTTDGMKKLLPPSGSAGDSRAYFSIRNWWARGKSPEPHHVPLILYIQH
jgi:phosphatidate phosphatase LPIN